VTPTAIAAGVIAGKGYLVRAHRGDQDLFDVRRQCNHVFRKRRAFRLKMLAPGAELNLLIFELVTLERSTHGWVSQTLCFPYIMLDRHNIASQTRENGDVVRQPRGGTERT
jgi:hypothetical protein